MSPAKTPLARLKDVWLRGRDSLIPILIGIASFFGVTSGRPLLPRNIAWLTDPDAQTYFLGWNAYRFSPWGMPPGISSRYGNELSSSIAFVDNVALLAIPFKALSHRLPNPFQYFGIWLLCCFVLQAWFAWLLMGLVTQLRFPRACGAALFVFAPPFLFRLVGHYQMEGQWLLLAALYVCFGPRRLSRGAAWPVLALTVSLVHSYMTAMVLGLWLSDWARRVWREQRTWVEIFQLVAVPALVAFGFWLAGLFMMGEGIVKSGFGLYRMNLASLVDPSGWSYLLKDFSEGKGDYEGFNYLGLGGLLIVLATLPALKDALPALRARRHYWPLLIMLGGLTLFALSNNIGLGSWNFEIPLSKALLDRANVLRGSGRMFWPVFYVIVWVLVRSLFKRYSPKVAAGILFVAVLVQAVDTSAGWLPIRNTMLAVDSSWPSPLKSSFWKEVPGNYSQIRMIPVQNREPNFEVFAYFAGNHDMVSDAFYAARIDEGKLRKAKQQTRDAVFYGKYVPGALYVVDRRFEHTVEKTLNPDFDWFGKVDGFLILAPGWKCRSQCLVSQPPRGCSTTCPPK